MSRPTKKRSGSEKKKTEEGSFFKMSGDSNGGLKKAYDRGGGSVLRSSRRGKLTILSFSEGKSSR